MNDNKTKPTDTRVADFLAKIDNDEKRADSVRLIEMMERVSGHPATMWGPSIIGFDTYHYVYESGREGDMCVMGFSPRKTSLVLYLLTDIADHRSNELEKLGPHTASKACLYIKRLRDVDVNVLEDLIKTSYVETKKQWP